MSQLLAGSEGAPPTYYQILGISPALIADEDPKNPQFVKRAYHRALLRHHPDKARTDSGATLVTHASPDQASTPKAPLFTVDQITTAYKTLYDTRSRRAYDLSLKAATQGQTNGGSGVESFQTGVENVDLDDLPFDEGAGVWYRGCRCGNERGFVFAEGDLEDASVDGNELLVGCRDCSLWMRVAFAVMDE